MSYKERVYEMVAVRPLPSLITRFNMIEALNEEHFAEYEMNLPSHLLDVLGDWCIAEDLANPNPHKASVEERPIISKAQEKRRKMKNVNFECEHKMSVLAYHVKNHSTFRKERPSIEE